MKVAVLCEESLVVRDSFIRRGHNAVSCDLLPRPGNHICGDCLEQDWSGFDLLICFPPCTHLSSSGARVWALKRENGKQKAAIDFFMALTNLPSPRIAIENPVGIISSAWRKPDQIIQPYQFGHAESKATCLWLKGLPHLVPTLVVDPVWAKNPDGTDYRDGKGKRYSPTHRYNGHSGKPNSLKARLRSRTFQGIADAMADQWGGLTHARAILEART